jgi:prevent-host-death family protein
MKTLPIAEVKSHLSEVLKEVEAGTEVAISNGRKKETIAVIIPYDAYKKSQKRQLGTLKGKVTVKFTEDFKITDEELLNS